MEHYPHPESPRLSPVDHPRSLLMRLAFWISRRQYGKVLAPMRYIYTRSWSAFMLTLHMLRAERRLHLPERTRLLIRYYTAHLNDCPFCADISVMYLQQAQVAMATWAEYLNYAENPRLSAADKSLLAYLEAINTTRTAPDAVWEELRRHWDDRAIVEITWLNASENYLNLMARPLGLQSDALAAPPMP